MAVHIGKEIRKRMEDLYMKPSVLAKRVNLTPQGLGRVFGKSFIQTDKLVKFCQVLRFNFFTLYVTDKELAEISNDQLIASAYPKPEYKTSQQVIAAQKKEIERLQLEVKDARTNFELSKILYERDARQPFPVQDLK